MGGANNICSDKTGTLTKNQMTVTKLWALEYVMEKFEKEDKILTPNLKELLGIGIALNSDAHPVIEIDGKFKQIGNKTECALLEMSYKLGSNFIDIRNSMKAINTVPFSSDRKRMSVIFYHESKKRYYIFSKGAPEILIESCKYYVNKTNNISPIDTAWKSTFQNTLSSFSSECLRNILLCYRQISKEESQTDHPEKL